MKLHLGQRILRRSYLLLFNNFFVNWFFILIGKDEWVQHVLKNWRLATYDSSKSPVENVGFSHLPEIEQSRNKMHVLLQETAKRYLKQGDNILEVGCGTGIFLIPLQYEYFVTGIDLSKNFLSKAMELVPSGKFIEGNYLWFQLREKYNLIFSESSLQYFPPGKLDHLFRKLHDDLLPGGLIIFHYSHALSIADYLYGDLGYVRYSPHVIEKKAKKFFSIVEHRHYTDERVVKKYDSKHYYLSGMKKKRTDTNLNTYLLIAQRKQ